MGPISLKMATVAEENPIGSGYFFPYGRGPRMCIGSDFATFYVKHALSWIYRKADVNLDPNQPYEQDFYFGVMLPKGIHAKFSEISTST